jgi:hypothetical protein
MTSRISRWRWLAALATAGLALGVSVAVAQIPSPPSTVFGSVTDQAGPVAENLPVQGYIGDKLCGTRGFTQFTGEGSARVTVYFVDVLSAEQTAGCGIDGADIRIKVGDRFATQTTKWKRGPVQLDITFGDVTPAPIPTFTPAPTNTPRPSPSQTPANGTPGTGAASVGTIPVGSPGAGSPVASLKGGVTNSTAGTRQSASSDSSGGFPLWAGALLVLVGIAAVGGGVGYAMSRSRRERADSAELDSLD